MDRPYLLQLTPLPDWDEGPLGRDYRVYRLFEAPDPAGFLAEQGQAIRALTTTGGHGVPREVLDALPALEVIAINGVGYDAIDLDLCRARGIAVGNTPDVLTGDVADLAVGMILALDRGMVGADAWVRSGDWARHGAYPLQRRVHGRRAGILGLGRIGRAIGQRLAAFDMEIGYTARTPKETPPGWLHLPDPVALAEWCDTLVVALAASAETRRIVGRGVLDALGREGMLVNISRGSTVDEAALLDALEAGKIRAAALDVFEGEPAPDPRFAALPNVLLQPHQASATVETRRAMGQMMRDTLAAHFAGAPLPARVV